MARFGSSLYNGYYFTPKRSQNLLLGMPPDPPTVHVGTYASQGLILIHGTSSHLTISSQTNRFVWAC